MTRQLRWVTWVTGVVALALVAGSCGLGDKQAQADRIIDEGKRLMAASALNLFIEAQVKVVPYRRDLVVQEPPRIAPGRLPSVFVFVQPKANAALLGRNDSGQWAIRFLGSAMYERIVPKTVAVGDLATATVPNNFNAITASERHAQLLTAGPPASTTSTTSARTLRRSLQIVREWAGFDFADIADDERSKHGGSFAINPVALLRLVTGVLAGSVERKGSIYRANVSRYKAERKLSEDERQVLDKVFRANAITRRVFPARFHFNAEQLTGFELTLRQQLSSKDRADLVIRVTVNREPVQRFAIEKPSRRGTVEVSSLTQLVTTVSGL